jgi:hypothetical protein
MRKLGAVLFVALNLLLFAAAARESSYWDTTQPPYEGKCESSEQC